MPSDRTAASVSIDEDVLVNATGARPLCPSSPCTEGAQLIGIVQEDGRVDHLHQTITIDAKFVKTAKAGRAPEKRFRFASPCLETGCGQWSASSARCGVIDKVMAQLETEGPLAPSTSPDCAIRDRCRWLRQLGEAACGACPEVVTDTLEPSAT